MSVNHRATFYSIHFQPHKLSVSFLHNVRGDNASESYEGPTVLTQHRSRHMVTPNILTAPLTN